MENFSRKFLKADLWKDFEAYFEYRGNCSGCWCMNHRYPMGLDVEGEAAKLSMKQLVETNRVYGVLAYVDGDETPVGWCSLDRKKTLPGHDCVGEEIKCSDNEWSIHCITSRSDYKNRGVEQYLMKEALVLAKDYNAKFVESYPEPSSNLKDGFKTWNTFNGYESEFKLLGFKKIDKNFGEAGEFYMPMICHLGD